MSGETSQPDLSVVIPVYNRGTLIRHTLESVHQASQGLKVEVVVVDDGSMRPVAEDLSDIGCSVDQLIRQENQGLLFARLTGLRSAKGRAVLFLDSDDLVSEDKLRGHVEAVEAGIEVSYTDVGRQAIDHDHGPVDPISPDAPLPLTTDPADFFIRVQPAPHSPAFDTGYLRQRVDQAPFPPSPLYNAVAEIWFYHICAPFPARVGKCPGMAIVGEHQGARLTNHWERLGVASLAVQEAFAKTCPAHAREARRYFAAKAFEAWRKLPRHFSEDFSRRLLNLWEHSPETPPLDQLGGGSFQQLARIIGPKWAAILMKRLRQQDYASCRTMDDAEFKALMAKLPQP